MPIRDTTIKKNNIENTKKEKYHCSTQLQSGSIHSAPAEVGEEYFIT